MKRLLVTIVGSGIVSLFGIAPVFGISPSQSECEANGGTFTRTNGTVECSIHVGNSDNSQTVDSGGQGNLDNKETCGGPGNSTAKCP